MYSTKITNSKRRHLNLLFPHRGFNAGDQQGQFYSDQQAATIGENPIKLKIVSNDHILECK